MMIDDDGDHHHHHRHHYYHYHHRSINSFCTEKDLPLSGISYPELLKQ